MYETARLQFAESRGAAVDCRIVETARNGNPECANCQSRRAGTFRIISEHAIVIGLCRECEGRGGAPLAKRVAREARRKLDARKAWLGSQRAKMRG
jgi:hypothetical protein